jgi:hypothetical protein
MSKITVLEFVSCPNEIHIGQEGWKAYQLYYAGNGIYKCASCGEEFTREQVQEEIQKDYARRVQALQRDYQQSLASLYRDKQDVLDKFDDSDAD